MNANTNTELGNETVAQLYDLAADPGEIRNLAEQYPEKVKEMAALLQKLREKGKGEGR
jgi:arylsulfatase A-like enzyme